MTAAAGAVRRDARLNRPELAPLWNELARRFGEGGTPPVAIRLRDLTLPQQQALADLLGSDRLPGPVTRLPVGRLATACGAGGVDGLRAVVEQLRGPLPDRRSVREAAQAGRRELWAWLEARAAELPILAGDAAGRAAWVAAVRAAGVPGADVPARRRKLEGILAALARLPADGVPLAVLAHDALGNPHGLDRGRSAAAEVLDAIAIAGGQPRPPDAEGLRRLWETAGVVCDPLSSTVLTLGLAVPGRHPLGGWLNPAAGAGEPSVLTLSQLQRWPLDALPGSAVVYVVENPSVVAEAAAGAWTGPPLVCSSGRPTVAVVTLLRQLGGAGAVIAQHADFDAAGVAITGWLVEHARVTPWRMCSGDYLGAVAAGRGRVPLRNRVPPTPWDPQLAAAMSAHGVAVYEEAVRAALLDAMADRPSSR